jgi:NAD(P)-dependent dehydrogenase (short-subunit alcohol dehydrogenase family)
MSEALRKVDTERNVYIVTGPTSGIGRATALELAKHGTVILVGRDRNKLDVLRKIIEREGRHALPVVCDLSDLASVRRAAAEIVALRLPIAGLLNNAASCKCVRRRTPWAGICRSQRTISARLR